ncbi:MAG: branched-chain amino acid aminotransferase, partial [Candidatus Omnitrophica bacterium]|nr:branched-chain amino acid aminotransferase [Candidatus Omnitrophota bacterium]
MGSKVLFNRKVVDRDNARVSIFDHGLLYGDGVFEGIRSYARRIFRLEEHTDRLYESAEAIRLDIPVSKEEFQQDIVDILRVNDLDDAYIRAVITRGPGDLGLDPRRCPEPTMFIIADKIKLYPEEFYQKGLSIIIAKTRRNHPSALDPRIKSLNYLNNIMAKVEAIDHGTHEAMMLGLNGEVVECTGDNIFIYKDGILVTPPSEAGSLKGVTQYVIMELAEKRGLKAEFRKMMPE